MFIKPVGKTAQPLRRPQSMAELDGCAASGQKRDRGVDQRARQPVAGDQRPAGAATGGERLANDGAGQGGGALAGLDVQRRQQQRPDEPVIKRPAQADAVKSLLSSAGAEEVRR